MKKLPIVATAIFVVLGSSSCTKGKKAQLAKINDKLAKLESARDDKEQEFETVVGSVPFICGNDIDNFHVLVQYEQLMTLQEELMEFESELDRLKSEKQALQQ